MFSDNKKGRATDPGMQQNRIAQGTKIVGNITSQGGFRIDGEVEGDITTPNKVVLGATGVLKGSLHCDDADVERHISGKVHIKNLLSLKSSAVIDGEVITGKLSIEPGATFNATCDMKGISKPAKDGKKA